MPVDEGEARAERFRKAVRDIVARVCDDESGRLFAGMILELGRYGQATLVFGENGAAMTAYSEGRRGVALDLAAELTRLYPTCAARCAGEWKLFSESFAWPGTGDEDSDSYSD